MDKKDICCHVLLLSHSVKLVSLDTKGVKYYLDVFLKCYLYHII